MKNKVYVLAFITVVCAAIIGVWILAWVMPLETYLDGEYPLWIQQKDYVHHDSDEIEVLFLGDSRMQAGVIPSLLTDNTYNLALGGATPLEMYYTLKNYLKHHPNPMKVFVAFGPTHYTEMEQYKNRNFYFHYLSREEEKESQKQIYISENIELKQQMKTDLENLQYDLRWPTIYAKAIVRSHGFGKGPENDKKYQKIRQDKGYKLLGRAESDNGYNIEATRSSFVVSRSCDYYMRKLLQLCIANNIPVQIEQLPMNEESYQKNFQNGYLDEYRQYMYRLRSDLGIDIKMEIPHYTADFFGDSSHLNTRGAERYTHYLKQEYNLSR